MKYLILIAASVFSISLSAAEVSGLNEFVAGEKALASEVNDNFDDVVNAINSNSADIEDKQNAITSSCSAGMFMTGVNSSGTPICAADQTGSNGTGDITSINTVMDSGLIGGVTNGDADLSVNTDIIQKRVTGNCAVGQVIRAISSDGNVTCASAPTDVISGIGMTDSTNPTTKAITVNVDPTYVQRKLKTACAVGSSIRDISADGTPICELDTDTTYTAGTGLTLSGNTFSLNTSTGTITKAAFRARMSTPQTIAYLGTDVLKFNTEDYDIGNDFNTSTNTFTIPETGFYHFTCSIMPSDDITSNARLYIGGDMVQVYPNNQAYQTITTVVNRLFTAGSSVSCRMLTNSAAGNTIGSGFSHFSGFKVN